METKLEKLKAYQDNKVDRQSEADAKAKERKKNKSSRVREIVTGYEAQGIIKTSLSGICSKERWDKIFGKKDTKTKSNKKAR